MAIITRSVKIQCQVSAAVELAWLLDLLVQNARYAEPALDELDRSLLPRIAALRRRIKERFTTLWTDRVDGCPELLLVASEGGLLSDEGARRLISWLTTLPRTRPRRWALADEAPDARRAIRRRVALLDSDIRVRRAYRDIVADVWEILQPAWERRGRAVAARSAAEWRRRVLDAGTAVAFVELMPPRHPLARAEPAAATSMVRRRKSVVVVPAYCCMSGGLVADLGDRLLIGVPASSLEPIRRTRDAAFVADRARVLSEPTRVHILIHLMTSPSGVMQITRALGMSQPVVSEHLRVLAAAGLVRRTRKAGRGAYTVQPAKVDRLLRDVRGTLARWG